MAIKILTLAYDKSFQDAIQVDLMSPCESLTESENLYDSYGGRSIQNELERMFRNRFESVPDFLIDFMGVVIKYDLNEKINEDLETHLDPFFHPRSVATRNWLLFSDYQSQIIECIDKVATQNRLRRSLFDLLPPPIDPQCSL